MSAPLDVAVIGGGITGLATAWHLAQRGAGRIAVLERAGVAAEATGVQAGGVRQQWATRVSCELALEAAALYADVAERLSARSRPALERCGYPVVADSQESLQRLAENVALQDELGIPSRIVRPEEAEELVPGFAADSIADAAWCSEDGYVDKPQGLVEAFAEAGARAGVELRLAEVVSLEPDGSGWALGLADGSVQRAEQVVVAAGYGAPAIVEPLGVSLPIEKHAKYLFYSDPIRERLLVVAPERRFAAKQLADGRVLASDLAAAGQVGAGRAEWRRTIQVGVETLLSVLEYVSYPLLVEGFYDVTPRPPADPRRRRRARRPLARRRLQRPRPHDGARRRAATRGRDRPARPDTPASTSCRSSGSAARTSSTNFRSSSSSQYLRHLRPPCTSN